MRKAHKALNDGGKLLITLPAMAQRMTELLIDDHVVFADYFVEPNFNNILKADYQAINACIADNLFRLDAINAICS